MSLSMLLFMPLYHNRLNIAATRRPGRTMSADSHIAARKITVFPAINPKTARKINQSPFFSGYFTLPASIPHAAAMSSPRLRRMVQVTPLLLR